MGSTEEKIASYKKRQGALLDEYCSNGKAFALSMIGALPQPDPATTECFTQAEIRLINLGKFIMQCLGKMVEQTREGKSEEENENGEGITSEMSSVQ